MQKKNLKIKSTNKGITLIALVITIIILIILAGISISMLLGDNGVIERAKRASQNYTIAAEEEQEYLEYLTGLLDDDSPDEDIIKEARGNGTLSGEGTESNPYLIQSIEDLVYLSNQVKGGNTYTGKHFKLEISLDFKDRKSYLNPDSEDFDDINENGTISTLFTELTTGKGFYSIGVDDYRFEGIFNGNNKSIRNIFGRSLFGYINNATIKNLKMLGVTIPYSRGGIIDTASGDVIIDNCKATGQMPNGGSNYGGIIGYATPYTGNSSNSLRISSTTNAITLTPVGNYKGGIVGYLEVDAEFKNCSNEGTIRGSQYVGGIVGYLTANAEFEDCSNTGTIYSIECSGGILGEVNIGTTTIYDSISINLTNCTNTGEITGNGSYIAGIAGYIYGYGDGTTNVSINFTKCTNTVDITGNKTIGGIVSYIYRCNDVNFIDCTNTGDITGLSNSAMNLAGIVGYLEGKGGSLDNISEFTNCSNSGSITGYSTLGGIVANLRKKSNFTNCSNTGSLTGYNYIGGIVGDTYGAGRADITNCYNSGTITASNTYAGGIEARGALGTISYCYNTGTLNFYGSSGGIVGAVASAGQNPTITHCYNSGTINVSSSTSNSLYNIGGIIGDFCSTSTTTLISYSYNTGNINVTASRAYQIGGICGIYGNVENCYNSGNITITSGSISNTGGILGYNTGNVTNCYNTGKITTTPDITYEGNIGGITGVGGTLENCYNIGKIETNTSTNYVGSVTVDSTTKNCYYLIGTHEKAVGGSRTYDVTAVENEDSMKSIMNTKFATIEGWKISTTGGYPEL